MADQDSIAVRAAKAAYMLEYNRKRGCMPVKGVQITCERCGCQTEKQHFAHNHCAACVHPAQIEKKRAKRAAAGTVTIGSSLICKNCRAECTKIHKRQFYCQPCMVLCAKEALPANRIRQNEYQKAYNKQRRETNPSFAISERMSAQIGAALREKKAGRSWESIVGYTLADLMAHLERQFVKGMNWDSRKAWHVDHIFPLSGFDLTRGENEIRTAWALSNLRPMWAAENIRKAGSRTHLC